MKKANLLIMKLSNPRMTIPSFFAFILVIILINAVLKPSFAYLTQTPGYTPSSAYALISQIGNTGRQQHLLVFLADVVMVGLYTVFLTGANYRAYHTWVRSCMILTVITFLPVLMAVIQLLEVAGLIVVIASFPAEIHSLAGITSLLTTIKYIFTPVCFVLPAVGFGVTIILNKTNKVRCHDRNRQKSN